MKVATLIVTLEIPSISRLWLYRNKYLKCTKNIIMLGPRAHRGYIYMYTYAPPLNTIKKILKTDQETSSELTTRHTYWNDVHATGQRYPTDQRTSPTGYRDRNIEKKCYLSVVIEQETTGCVCINVTHKNESTDICGCIWFVFNLKSDRLHFGWKCIFIALLRFM